MAASDETGYTEDPSIAHHDWRNQVVTTVSADAYLPNGRRVAKGALVKAVGFAKGRGNDLLRFSLPSTPALMIDFSHRMHAESVTLLPLFDTKGSHSAELVCERDDEFFELIERRMACIMFAYTAIEAFANEQISAAYEQHGYIHEADKNGVVSERSAADIERHMSLGDKLTIVLCDIFGVKARLKDTESWRRFRALEDLRHRIVHNKAVDRVPNAKGETLWSLLATVEHRDYSVDAKRIMEHFLAFRTERTPRFIGRCPF